LGHAQSSLNKTLPLTPVQIKWERWYCRASRRGLTGASSVHQALAMCRHRARSGLGPALSPRHPEVHVPGMGKELVCSDYFSLLFRPFRTRSFKAAQPTEFFLSDSRPPLRQNPPITLSTAPSKDNLLFHKPLTREQGGGLHTHSCIRARQPAGKNVLLRLKVRELSVSHQNKQVSNIPSVPHS